MGGLDANLKMWRLDRGLTQAEVAERAELSLAGYQRMEQGRSAPRPESLGRIARALGVREADLLRERRRLRQVRFRAHKRLKTRDAVLADVGRWLTDFASLEEMLGDEAGYRFSRVARRFRGRARGAQRAREAAQAAREAVGLGEGELVRDICGLLEDHGVKVLARPVLSDAFFGLSVGPADGGPAVVVNVWDRIPVERWIFSAAHELGHLILHLDAFDAERVEEDEDEEREANEFASHFLMPQATFESEWNQASGHAFVHRVLKVKRIFRVSWKTVAYRVQEMEGDPGVWQRFYAQYKRFYGKSLSGKHEPDAVEGHAFSAQRAAEEPAQLHASDFVLDRLERLVRRALEEERITLSRAAAILGLDVRGMRQLHTAWTD
jgi:Zn-dependent peptidase ImmA (M78 family)/transcriptional regulator with XRE-family HTH domain